LWAVTVKPAVTAMTATDDSRLNLKTAAIHHRLLIRNLLSKKLDPGLRSFLKKM
jgi:ethanolamine ammonia-lyase large subunit